MAVRPILFSGPMVRALLAGTKTQTRRILKLVPPEDATEVHTWFAPPDVPTRGIPNRWAQSGLWAKKPGAHGYVRYVGAMPYRPGDVLWVRETWGVGTRPDPHHGWRDGIEFKADGVGDDCSPLHDIEPPNGIAMPEMSGWRPSIHMPRWVSRITLVVTDVRVQRLQEISEPDAIAEGIEPDDVGSAWRCYAPEPKGQTHWLDPRESYRTLWNSINGSGSWEANPWAAAYTFSTHHQNVDAFLKAREAA